MKSHTPFKIGCGYVLLIVLLLCSVRYVYRQMSALTRMNDNETVLAERRKATHQLVCQLFEAENIGQTVRLGHWEAYRKYVQSLMEVQQSIASLDSLFTDSLQKARLDTLSSLLDTKRDNMRRMILALEDTPSSQVYHQQIKLFIQNQDTLIQQPHITRKVIQKDRSYTVEEPKRNFFQRLADAFHKPKADTTSVKNTVQILETDTLHQSFNARDTLAHILDSIESTVKLYSTQRRQRINAQAEKLWATSIDLNGKVAQLLESIEKEEQELQDAENRTAYLMRRQAAITTGSVAVAAIVLALAFFVIVWRDITRSNHYRRELEKAKQRAEDLLVSREKLMLTVTHDIKAPVGAVMGYAELLAPHVKEHRAQNYLRNIQSSSEHLLSLVNSLLDYHKLEANKMDIHPASFSPSGLLHTITQSFLPMAEKKGLELRCETAPETDRTYTGDASRIRQIVENLVSNALKFTRQGHVLLRAKMHGRTCCISVSDTGCGMSPEEQAVVFKEFTRLDSAQGEEGVGLGLSITLKLVRLLHGDIHVDSTPGEGSTFFVTLPLQPATATADKTPATPETTTATNRPLSILLVDDDRIQLQLTQAMLRQLQPAGTTWDIHVCHQPDEVFRLIRKQLFDLMLTDIQMPGINGFELLKRLRESIPATSVPPAVALTARSDMQEDFFRLHGFATCLYKPFNQEELARAIRKALAPTSAPGVTLDPLTAFAGDDEAAAREILRTFLQETLRHAESFQKACQKRDKAEVCRLAHKLLPTFTLIQASCTQALQVLEQRRDETEWTDKDNEPAEEILRSFPPVIRALQEKLQ